MSTQNTNRYEKNSTRALYRNLKRAGTFLKRAGRFAALSPLAVTLLLGTSLNSKAIAKSGGSRPGKG
ncbi:hypothetical protein FJ941_25780 [Mesorhizobium sp. B2-3-13]|nr:hypothetical protein FJ941_25780 [Mesorhizobium sp. B2-3-13]